MNCPPKCKLTFYSNVHHHRQLLAGFKILNNEGIIKLVGINFEKDWKNNKEAIISTVKKGSLLKAEINQKTIIYDMHDSSEINKEARANSDLYIKRSYCAIKHQYDETIQPLGLYINAIDKSFDIDRAKLMYKFANGSGRIIGILNSLTGRDYPTYSYLEKSFSPYEPPKVLFLTRLWAPTDAENKNQKEEREIINENRSRCVLSLREQLGTKFFGGIIPDDYSRAFCPEAILDDLRITKRRNYLKFLRKFPICISTLGLHGSTGAKFSEYIAFGKAIISEKFAHDYPPNLIKGTHFLEYKNIDECALLANQLIDDHSLRKKLMFNAKLYYNQELKPDFQVLKSICHIL